MQHKLIPTDDPSAWRSALDGIAHGFGDSWENAVANHHATGQPTFLYAYSNGACRVACPLMLRSYEGYFDIASPMGFGGFASTGECSGFREQWFAFARQSGWVCAYLSQNPALRADRIVVPEDIGGGPDLFYLNLTVDEQTLFGQISRCRRRQIIKWRADSHWLCTNRAEILAFMHTHSASFFDRVKYSGPRLTHQAWTELAASPNVLLLGAMLEGRIVAANLFGWAGELGDAPYNISLPEGRDAAAPLMWAGANLLRQKGVKLLNMGGGARPGDGIETSKRRFNCTVMPLQRIRQVFRPQIFDRLCQMANHPDTEFFPPYHAPGR